MTPMTLRDVKLRLRSLFARGRVEQELDDELAFHIECETRKLMGQGVDPADAAASARRRFGSTALSADQCRDARGTAFIDASARDVLYAFRAFRRAPLSALTIVATVGLGLALIVSVFTLYNAMYLRGDAVRDIDELFEVRRTPRAGAGVWLPLTRLELESMRRDTAVFSDAFGMMQATNTRIEGKPMACSLVTGNFFHVLGVNAALGRTLSADDDERFAGRQVIVLSHRGWIRLAGGDPKIVGRSVMINGAAYEVIGVTPEEFRGLGYEAADYWAPASLGAHFLPAYAGKEDTLRFSTVIGRLRPGLSQQTAVAGLGVWATSIAGEENRRNGRFTNITLSSLQPTFLDLVRSLKFFGPIFFAFGLILLIGCANVANLLMARGVARQREIGIRLSLGASRRRIVRQLLTESLLLAMVSAALGLVLSRVILGAAVYGLTTTMPAELVESLNLVLPSADWRVIAFLLLGAVMSTLFFGLAPALRATRLELVRTMRGEVTKDARPRRARHALIAAQVGASALMLICAGVFLRAAFETASADTGVRTTDTLIVGIANEPLRPATVQAVSGNPSIAAVAASWPATTGMAEGAFVEAQPGGAGTSTTRVGISYRFVSPEYFDVLGIDIRKGRAFSNTERIPESGVAVISETVANRLWPGRDPLGQALQLADAKLDRSRDEGPPLSVRRFTVVGVARDVVDEVTWASELQGNGVYLPTNAGVAGTSLTVRAHGDPEQARRALLDSLTRVDPSMGEIRTLRSIAAVETYLLRAAFAVTAVLGCLALLLTVSGLFSVLSYLVEQRKKEIGVRMALGATGRHVARLVLLETVRPVGIGLVCGSGLALLLATALMSTRAAAQIGEMADVFDPAAYAGSMLAILTACMLAASIPVSRAARIDPLVILKED